jgi:hypothetical protein
MKCGVNMPSNEFSEKQILANDWIVDKLLKLQARIHSHNPNIDDVELRWVERKIEDFNGGIVEERECFKKANELWSKWK